VFLEEYGPRTPFAKRLHAFIQLNIANLAGVPSIVYGIIGLTVFVQLFGLNNPNQPDEPWWTFGVKWFDSFYVESTDQYVQVRVDGGSTDPIALTAGTTMTMIDDDGNEVAVQIVAADADTSATQGAVLRADTMPFRIDEKAWYHVQIPFGRGVLAGGLTLMLVILPIVIVSSQESLRAVPDSLREGAFGLGATRWQTVRRITLPAAVPGIMTGSILAMSRAIGEAAPILIIAGVVYITFTPKHLIDDFTAMPLQIYDWAGRPQEAFHQVAATGIIVLLAVLLTFNSIAVLVRQKFQKPLS
jgi:phosphate transport system permease protein